MKLPRVVFCGLGEVGTHLSEPSRFSSVISIGDPGDPAPPSLADWAVCDAGRRFVRLEFHDVSISRAERMRIEDPKRLAKKTLCDRALVATLLAFDDDRPGHILVHCTAGASRSPACALLLNAQQLGLGHELEAAQMTDIRPCYPNSLVVRLGDELLGCNGALCKAWERVWVPPAPENWSSEVVA